LSLSDSVRLYSSVILIYLLTTRRVPGYLISYSVGYLDNELPDNGSPTFWRALVNYVHRTRKFCDVRSVQTRNEVNYFSIILSNHFYFTNYWHTSEQMMQSPITCLLVVSYDVGKVLSDDLTGDMSDSPSSTTSSLSKMPY